MKSQQKNLISAAAALILAVAIVLGFDVDLFGWIGDPESLQQPATTTAKVINVIDGDTFTAQIGSTTESVRLIGIDAPEITWPNEANSLDEPEAECFGWEARAELSRYVSGESVELVGDRRQPAQDRYDRRLAYVYVGDRMVNKELLVGGFVYELTVGPGYEKQDEFRQAEARAKESYSGLWAGC